MRQAPFLPPSGKPTHGASPSGSSPDLRGGANGFQPHPDISPAIWEHYYEAAIATRNPEIRLLRRAEAQALILRRAEALEKATDAECKALEDAAEFLQGLKSASMGDGVGKQVEVGDVEPISEKTGKPDDPVLKKPAAYLRADALANLATRPDV